MGVLIAQGAFPYDLLRILQFSNVQLAGRPHPMSTLPEGTISHSKLISDLLDEAISWHQTKPSGLSDLV